MLNMLTIAVFSPVPNIHKPLTEPQKKRTHIWSIVIGSVLSAVGIVLFILKAPIGAMIITSVTMVSVLIIAETIMQRRGYHES